MKKLSSDFEYKDKVLVKSANLVIYREATLLVPGIYADSATKSYCYYTEKSIKKYAKNWDIDYISVDHSKDVLKRIGKVKNPKFKNGKLVGDLHIYTVTSVAKDVVKLIDNGLINWMSVEVDTKDKYNYDLDVMETKELRFVGCSVVTTPACRHSKIIQDGPDVPKSFYE